MRKKSEILTAEEEFLDKVWYNRSFVYDSSKLRPDILVGREASRMRVEEKYGEEALGPFDDFEWGMINGKLSALRWVMGEDWDMLDT